jgi:hypothetical protein
MAKRINIYMKQRLFEDDQMYDVQRQTSGMGSEIANQGPITVNNISHHRNNDDNISKSKLYPIDSIEQTIGDAFVNISNVHQLIQIAEENPTFDKSDLSKLRNTLKGMANLLVDFDEIIVKIKGNDR